MTHQTQFAGGDGSRLHHGSGRRVQVTLFSSRDRVSGESHHSPANQFKLRSLELGEAWTKKHYFTYDLLKFRG